MITATCTNTACTANSTPFLMLGEPPQVQCGACHNDCKISDPQPDPPQPELLEE